MGDAPDSVRRSMTKRGRKKKRGIKRMAVAKEKWSVQVSISRVQKKPDRSMVGPRVVVVCDAVQKSRSELFGMTDAKVIDLVTPSQQPLSAKAH